MVFKDHCMYVNRTTQSRALYVDDIPLTGNNMEMINATKQWLSSTFQMKDMGEARYVLGVEIVMNHPKRLLGMC